MNELSFLPFPNLITERLSLRQLRIEDAEQLVLIRSDERVNEFIIRPKSISPEEAKTKIADLSKGIAENELLYWGITFSGEDKIIGTICLWNFDKINSRAEVGFELYPDYQGMGLMQEALREVLKFATESLGLGIIDGFVNENNKKSIGLLGKFNFKRDHVQEKVIDSTPEELSNFNIYSLKIPPNKTK